jgi:hypothetical protein
MMDDVCLSDDARLEALQKGRSFIREKKLP